MGQGQSTNVNSLNTQSSIKSTKPTNAANTMTTPNGIGVAPQAGGKSRRNRKNRH